MGEKGNRKKECGKKTRCSRRDERGRREIPSRSCLSTSTPFSTSPASPSAETSPHPRPLRTLTLRAAWPKGPTYSNTAESLTPSGFFGAAIGALGASALSRAGSTGPEENARGAAAAAGAQIRLPARPDEDARRVASAERERADASMIRDRETNATAIDDARTSERDAADGPTMAQEEGREARRGGAGDGHVGRTDSRARPAPRARALRGGVGKVAPRPRSRAALASRSLEFRIRSTHNRTPVWGCRSPRP